MCCRGFGPALLLLLVFGVGAAPGGDASAPHAEPENIITLKGTVTGITKGPLRQGGKAMMVRLTLKTARETLQVVLGPAPYVDNQALKLAVGDELEVRALRVITPRGTFIDALEVKKGDQVMVLRDDQGAPVWGRGLLWEGPGPKR